MDFLRLVIIEKCEVKDIKIGQIMPMANTTTSDLQKEADVPPPPPPPPSPSPEQQILWWKTHSCKATSLFCNLLCQDHKDKCPSDAAVKNNCSEKTVQLTT